MPDDHSADEMLDILVLDNPEDRDKGIFSSSPTVSVQRISVAALRRNLRATIGGVRTLFDEIAAEPGDMPLKQAQIQLEVSAAGGVTLVGSGQIASKGAITLTFEARPASTPGP